MLSNEACRRLLPPSASLTDQEVERLRDDLMAIAELIFRLTASDNVGEE